MEQGSRAPNEVHSRVTFTALGVDPRDERIWL